MKSKIFESIKQLEKQGYKIKYRKRTDRGYIVSSINGKSFKGAQGNAEIRKLTNTTISQKVLSANRRISKTRKEILPKSLLKALKRTQRIWNANKPKGYGKIKKTDVVWKFQHEGLEMTLKSLTEHERYAKGLAYSENIATFKAEIERTLITNSLTNPQFKGSALNIKITKIIDFIEKKGQTITEAQIKSCFEALYKKENGDPIVNDNDSMDRIIDILNIK